MPGSLDRRSRRARMARTAPWLVSGCLAALLGISGLSGAADYYVAKTGLDANPGSDAAPWLTISKAATVLQAGDTVHIRAGVYNERVTVKVQGSAAGGYITFRNYGNDTAVIDGAGIDLTRWPYGGLIEAAGKSYLRIQGLRVRNTQGNASGGIGIMITGGTGASHIELINNEVYNHTGIAAIACVGNGISDLLIADNQVHHCNTNAQEGIRVAQGVRNFRILNNRVHDTSNIGIDCVGRGTVPTYGLVQGNVVYRTGQTAPWAHAIYVDDAAYIVVQDNLCYDNQCGIAFGAEDAGGVAHHLLARRNVIYGCSRDGIMLGSSQGTGKIQDCAAVHNTLMDNNLIRFSNQWSSELIINYCQGANLFKNNIVHDLSDRYLHLVYNLTSAPLGGFVLDHNDYRSGPPSGWLASLFSLDPSHNYATLAAWQSATGQDLHSIAEDPAFVNADEHDLSLAAGSPCIDAGGFVTYATSAGAGSVIPAADVRVFSDGYGGLFPGDRVQVGSQAPALLLHIDYGASTLQVDRSLSWAANDGISLPYVGARPDLGAYEHGAAVPAGVVAGYVSEDSGAPLAGVVLSSNTLSARSDAFGNYSLTLPAGQHSITASLNGYWPQTQIVYVVPQDQVLLNWKLVSTTSPSDPNAVPLNWGVSPTAFVKGRSPGEQILFYNLPPVAQIQIFTLAGRLVRSMSHESGSSGGSQAWDLSGVSSGIYLYEMRSVQGKKKGKLIVIK